MKYLLSSLFVLAMFLRSNVMILALSEEELTAIRKGTRKDCQAQSGATDEQLEDVYSGVFDGNSNIMAYVECCYTTYNIMKNGQFDYESAVRQVDVMPEERQEGLRIAFAHCKDDAVGADKYEIAYNFAKCLYTRVETNHFHLP